MLSRIFKSGNSQAVRIPKELQFPRSDIEVEIERVGDALVIRQVGGSLEGVLEKFSAFAPDFMSGGRGENEEAERPAL
jgi:antitoxin VapB